MAAGIGQKYMLTDCIGKLDGDSADLESVLDLITQGIIDHEIKPGNDDEDFLDDWVNACLRHVKNRKSAQSVCVKNLTRIGLAGRLTDTQFANFFDVCIDSIKGERPTQSICVGELVTLGKHNLLTGSKMHTFVETCLESVNRTRNTKSACAKSFGTLGKRGLIDQDQIDKIVAAAAHFIDDGDAVKYDLVPAVTKIGVSGHLTAENKRLFLAWCGRSTTAEWNSQKVCQAALDKLIQ